jgi:hypothetical protein
MLAVIGGETYVLKLPPLLPRLDNLSASRMHFSIRVPAWLATLNGHAAGDRGGLNAMVE